MALQKYTEGLRGTSWKMPKYDQLIKEEQTINNELHTEQQSLSPNKILGNNYEAHIGDLLESQGFSVIYTGFKFGYFDKHVDLIAFNKAQIVFVQCKFHSTPLKFKVIDDLVYSKDVYQRLINDSFGIHWNERTNILNQFESIEFRLYCRYKQSKEFEEYANKLNVEVIVENIDASYKKTYDDNDLRYIPISDDESRYLQSRKVKMEKEMQKHLYNELSSVVSYAPTKEKISIRNRIGCLILVLFITGFIVYGIYSVIYIIMAIVQNF